MSSTLFRVFHVVNAIAMFVAAVFFFIGFGFPGIPLAIYVAIFGIAVLAVEFRYAKTLVNNMSFLFNWYGRAAFYLFVGLICWFGFSAYSIPAGILYFSTILCIVFGLMGKSNPSP
eukprot:TRINITY_DN1331_c0_g4_i1.p1 TRINITY_DN1331_c0_g4~~TRINITY_DN1331_c0_g4_i1.p1  ORF type:complete len:116 (+),score=25.45 TRINITY_DN1331_c0_g4_i1:62-409(+)